VISAADAKKCILENIRVLNSESLPLPQVRGRFLATDLHAPIFLPPFDNSAMDGFALRASEIQGASPASSVSLQVVEVLAAGTLHSTSRILQSGEAVRIMTGAPLPPGADTVVPFEEAEEKNGLCVLKKAALFGKHVRKKGEDVEKGSLVLTQGTCLNPRNMALLAALGFAQVSVTRLPRLAIFSTGNELKPLGSVLEPGQIYDSNGPTLSLALQELGLESKILSTPRDTLQDLLNTFEKASDAEVMITMGAVSAGDFDLIPQALKKLGAEILFHKIAIKPGKPLLFARWKPSRGERRFVFCLPGNPVSSLVVFDRFVRPALLKMSGAISFFRKRYVATASQKIKATAGKEDYLRAQVEWKEGSFHAQLAGSQGSAHLVSLAKSNALLIVPESRAEILEGEKVEFEFWGNEG